jgi:hypothetical protein
MWRAIYLVSGVTSYNALGKGSKTYNPFYTDALHFVIKGAQGFTLNEYEDNEINHFTDSEGNVTDIVMYMNTSGFEDYFMAKTTNPATSSGRMVTVKKYDSLGQTVEVNANDEAGNHTSR